jgi:ankyrin repeat protein
MFGVDKIMTPLIEFVPPANGQRDDTPTKDQALQFNKDYQKKMAAENGSKDGGSKGAPPSNASRKRDRENLDPSGRRNRRGGEVKSMKDLDDSEIDSDHETPSTSPPFSPQQSKKKLKLTADDYYASSGDSEEALIEKYRSTLMAIFLHDDPNYVPSFLSAPSLPPGFDIDLVIDDQGHTALHWAAALARVKVLRLLLAKSASPKRTNYSGESALIRAVIVTNNYDSQTFKDVLTSISDAIPLVDNKGRTLLHHMALTAGIKGRVQASRYYMDVLFEWIRRHGGDFKSIVNAKDKNGDTALNIAARIGNRGIMEELIAVGADPSIENHAGLKPSDFGFDDLGVLATPAVANKDVQKDITQLPPKNTLLTVSETEESSALPPEETSHLMKKGEEIALGVFIFLVVSQVSSMCLVMPSCNIILVQSK